MERLIEKQKMEKELEKKFRKDLNYAKDFVKCFSLHICSLYLRQAEEE